MKFQAGENFYSYVGNNPVNGNDPSGMDMVMNWMGNTVNANFRIVYTGSGANPLSQYQFDSNISSKLTGTNLTAPAPYSTGGAYSSYNMTTTVTSVISQNRGEIASLVNAGYTQIALVPQFSGQQDPLGGGGQMAGMGTRSFTSSNWYSVGSYRTTLTGGVWNVAIPAAAAHEALHIGNQRDQYDGGTLTALPGFANNIMGYYDQPMDARNVAGLINVAGGGASGLGVHLNGSFRGLRHSTVVPLVDIFCTPIDRTTIRP